MTDKVITFTIPCYNSADYMDHCIESILKAGDDIEVLIVDDGSTKDNTPEKADEWQRRCPDIIRAIHQENKGHGGAVNTGIANATGVFFKVVDSDDWLDEEALHTVMERLRGFVAEGVQVDMLCANYVYEHQVDNTQKVIDYLDTFPRDRVFTWDELGKIHVSRNILMHTVIYRTQVLRDSGIQLPEHTFYVDNLFVYIPFPYVKTLYYVDAPLYRYFIGRDDQSVNMKVMVGRIDQHIAITKIMIDHSVSQAHLVTSERLKALRSSYTSMMMSIASTLLLFSKEPGALKKRSELWAYLKKSNPELWRRCRFGLRNGFTNLPTPLGRLISKILYYIAQKIYKFN